MKEKMMDDVENVGIMQGFLDMARQEDDDLEEEEDSEEGTSARMLNRSPDSPEILMNNLRGDMRSVDARREELADLVGYKAAADTPDSVLAMLQPVLAQGAGLGALPQSGPVAQGPQAPMPPPPGGSMGMPPQTAPPAPSGGDMAALLAAATPAPGGGMAPGAMVGPDGRPIPQEGVPPIQMRDGGFVQHFRDGSKEEGVTPSEDQMPSTAGLLPVRMSNGGSPYAESYAALLNSLGPSVEVPSLEEGTKRKMAQFEELGLAPSPQSAKANILFDIAGAALGYASNRGPSGEALTGSGLSRFAGAFSALPAAIQKRAMDIQDTRRKLSLIAIEGAEKDRQLAIENDQKLAEESRRIALAAINAEAANARTERLAQARENAAAIRAATSRTGGPLSSRNLNYMVSVLPAIESGQATNDERLNFIAAYDDYTARGNPIINPSNGEVMGYNTLPIDPRFTAAKALAAAGAAPATGATGAAVPPAAPGADLTLSGVAVPPRGLGGQPTVTLGGPAPITAYDILNAGMVGPEAVIQAAIGSLPFEAAGEIGAAELTSKDALTRMTSEIRKNIDGGSRILKAQYEEMARAIDLTPKFFNNIPATVSRFAELSLKLRRDEEEARRLAEYPTDQMAWQNAESFDRGTRQEYAQAAAELGRLQRMLNMPDVFIGRDNRAVEPVTDIAKRYAARNGIPLNTPFILPMLSFSQNTGNWEILKEQALVSSYE